MDNLSEELIQLNDEFARFSAFNAFMAHALALSLAEHDWLNPEIISGARLCADEVQLRTGKLKEHIKNVQERYIEQHPEN